MYHSYGFKNCHMIKWILSVFNLNWLCNQVTDILYFWSVQIFLQIQFSLKPGLKIHFSPFVRKLWKKIHNTHICVRQFYLYTTHPIFFLNITFMSGDFYTLILLGGVTVMGLHFESKSYLVIDVTNSTLMFLNFLTHKGLSSWKFIIQMQLLTSVWHRLHEHIIEI